MMTMRMITMKRMMMNMSMLMIMVMSMMMAIIIIMIMIMILSGTDNDNDDGNDNEKATAMTNVILTLYIIIIVTLTPCFYCDCLLPNVSFGRLVGVSSSSISIISTGQAFACAVASCLAVATLVASAAKTVLVVEGTVVALARAAT